MFSINVPICTNIYRTIMVNDRIKLREEPMAFGLFRKKEVLADRIFYNGHIYTMDPELPWAEAVAVSDGKIMSVGNYEEMESIIGSDTETFDLEGKYLFPGFIDIHHSPVMKMMELHYQPAEEPPEEEEEETNVFSGIEGMVYEEEDEDGDEVEIEVTDEEEYEDETEYYVDNSELRGHVREALEKLSDHGITTVLDIRTPYGIENEFEDMLIELYMTGSLRQRFMGSLYVGKPVPPVMVKEFLSMRRTKCVELGDMVRNEFLYILLDTGEGRDFPQKALNDILAECSDRGFSIFAEAVTREDLLKVYDAVEHIRNKGYKNTVIIASDEELTDEEDSELSYSGTVYTTWRADPMGESFFEGAITDIEEAIEHLTMESAEMIGMDDVLGSIERGKYADFAVFSENPLERRAGDLSRLYCDMTVVDGEIVHDVDVENEEFMLDLMLHSR